eukprot:364806-Chlamydomonas_euryale.AAC.7
MTPPVVPCFVRITTRGVRTRARPLAAPARAPHTARARASRRRPHVRSCRDPPHCRTSSATAGMHACRQRRSMPLPPGPRLPNPHNLPKLLHMQSGATLRRGRVKAQCHAEGTYEGRDTTPRAHV